jgi:glycosyltransferase involved in cell wall biosynthesis
VAGGDGGKSGLGVYFREMLPRLAEELASRGIETVSLGTRAELDASDLRGTRTISLPRALDRSGISAAASLGLGSALARLARADVVYVPAANRRTFFDPFVPVVGTVHDLAQLAAGGRFGLLRDTYVRRLVTPTLRRMQIVLAVSESTRRDLIAKAGVEPDRVRVVPNGVRFCGRGRPRPRAAPYLLYPARLEHPAKNHVRLLEAFASSSLRASHDLILPGADWGAGELLTATVERLGLRGRVVFPGFISDEALAALLEHADAVVAAGLCEGFGLPAAEAIALGHPVAFAEAGALPEIVGDIGVGFDPFSVPALRAALERVVGDEALRARCRVEGPRRAERFSWSNAVRATADALQEVVDAAA